MQTPCNYFLATAPGLEELLLQEVLSKFQDLDPQALRPTPGGLEFEGHALDVHRLNLELKIATKVLLRVASFRCRDFPRLYQKIKKIPWHQFLKGPCVEVKSTAFESRLFDSRKISKAVEDGIGDYFKGRPAKKKDLDQAHLHPPIKVQVRFFQDDCQISLDTSGERLGKRGELSHVGVAPLRENLAAACLWALALELKDHKEQEGLTLIDPFCGRGTFLYEAASWNKKALRREFAKDLIPLFDPHPQVSPPGEQKDLALKPFSHFLGQDIDPDLKSVWQHNFSAEKIKDLAPNDFKFEIEDFFDLNQKRHLLGPCALICNPPYGMRLGGKDYSDLNGQYKKIISTIIKKYNPIIFAVLMPEEVVESALERLCQSQDYERKSAYHFDHGGQKVRLNIYSSNFSFQVSG